jgi:large subunit ribosomal protein L13
LKNSILCLEVVLKQERITKFVKPEDADQKWYLVDAKDQILGRLAVKIARVIRGKNKPAFTPNMDAGDFVVVINADKIRVTGKRESMKEYFSYSGYPGGGKFRSYSNMVAKKPEWVIENAVKGMLPKTRLGKKLIKKLKVYTGESHPHAAQQPVELK